MENIKFKNFGVMLDCSRNAVRNIESLKTFINYLSQMGYNSLQLYTEDTFEIENEEYFGYLRGRYTKEELKEIVNYAKTKNIEVIPCIQTLAHLNQMFKWDKYNDINDCRDILLCGEEKTYELLDKMFASVRECFTTNTINIGMDEAHSVGLGKYLRLNGYQNRFEIILKHLNRVNEIAKKYNFKPLIWSDMFFRLANNSKYYADHVIDIPKEVTDKVPENIGLIYWDYYKTEEDKYEIMMKSHKQFNNEIWFAGGCWTWGSFAPHNKFSMRANKAAFKMAIKNNIENVFLTMWGDDGAECSYLSVLPSLYHASCLAKGITNMSEIKKGFKEMFGIDFDKFLYVDLPDEFEKKETEVITHSKYILYSDLFSGFLDGKVSNEHKNLFKTYSKKLSLLTKNEEFGYIFDSMKALCDICYLKADLGLKTRKAYKEKNKEELLKLIKDYSLLIKKIEVFHEKFQTLWFKENKAQGFDIQDIRLGGLIQRVKSCKNRLKDLVDNKIEKIDELEDELIDNVDINIKQFRHHQKISSVNIFSHS